MPTIRELRLARGLSQQALSSKAHISMMTLSRMELGKPVLRATVDAVAKALGVSPNAVTGVIVLNRVQRGGGGDA